MIETAGIALATMFAMVGPIDIAAIFAALTATATQAEKRSIAIRGTIIATIILMIFALAGKVILESLGISMAALRAAGGILLLLISIDMVFARQSGATTATDEEREEAQQRQDIAVFPLATPLIAGPGAIGAAILLMANAEGEWLQQLVVIGSILAIMLLALLSMLAASQVDRIFGTTGIHAINRVFGVLVAALAVQFIFDGVAESGIFAMSVVG